MNLYKLMSNYSTYRKSNIYQIEKDRSAKVLVYVIVFNLWKEVDNALSDKEWIDDMLNQAGQVLIFLISKFSNAPR